MRPTLVAVLATTLFVAGPAAAAPPLGLDARVEALMKATGAPGMAIAIVEEGKVTVAKGYGVRRLGQGARVDADTIFMTGSTGKAFTAAALATLVDGGRIGWDDRVVDHLPGFQMYDAWVTREMTVRDLLVHRSGLGLGMGDLLMVPRGKLSMKEVVARLRHMKPATSFRNNYAYDNILYTVAGALIEEVSGQRFEDYLAAHVFRPAGMADATAEKARQLSAPNRAQPHARFGGITRGTGPQKVLDERDRLAQSGSPAGLMAFSANDMARWLQVQLGGGATPGGKRVFSAAAAREMWTPVTPIPVSAWPAPLTGITPTYDSYALGWQVRDYCGARVVWHAGGLFGFTSVVVMLPERKVGFALLLNNEEIEPRLGLMYELLDHYLGAPAAAAGEDWPTRFAAFKRARIAGAEAAVAKATGSPAKAGPSLALAGYAGRYEDPWYGTMAVTSDAKGLAVDFTTTPQMTGRLRHHQYDTFVADFDDPAIEDAYLTFALDAEGKVARVTAKPVSPIADFSFDYADLLFTPKAAGQPAGKR